ncbi:MAG: amidohydrolase family protein [Alphaproteobacteria bacterium]
MTRFVMDADYLPFHPHPAKPIFVAPPGAVDAHCHVFGPGDKFPYHEDRKYTPCDAGKEKLFELREHLGLSRNVIVQASCHGPDNRALIDALNSAGDLARGVAFVTPDVSEADLLIMHEAGVRGVRFNFLKRLVDNKPRSDYWQIIEKIKPFGWHVVVYFEANELFEIEDLLNDIPMKVVIDHMGRPDVKSPLDHPDYLRIKSLMDNEKFWIKVSCPERLTRMGPPYDDVVPFAKDLVASFSDRVLWGTDWPHPNMKSHQPDEGMLLDLIPTIAPTEDLQRKLLVDNPMKLYWS